MATIVCECLKVFETLRKKSTMQFILVIHINMSKSTI